MYKKITFFLVFLLLVARRSGYFWPPLLEVRVAPKRRERAVVQKKEHCAIHDSPRGWRAKGKVIMTTAQNNPW